MAESSDPHLNQNYRVLCAAVGDMFIRFARLEGALTSLLKVHLADRLSLKPVESIRLAGALYGSMRFKASRDTIKRVAASEGESVEVVAFVQTVFDHVGHIEDLRDKLAHHTLVPAPDDMDGYWQITDVITTRDVKNPKIYVFDTEAVAAASTDLNVAAHRLGRTLESGTILSGVATDLSPIAWRYKPTMLRLVPLSKLRASPEG